MEAEDIVIMENSLRYLSRNLVFPRKKDVNNPGVSFHLKFVALNLSTVMFLTGNILHLMINIKRKTYINLDLDLALAISLLGSYYFNFSYIRQVKNTINIYKQLSDLRSYGIPKDFYATNKKLNNYSKYHYIYIVSAVLGLSVAPLLEYKKCRKENVVKNINEICGLIGSIWLPIDLDSTPYKQMYYIFQVYSSFVIYQTSSLISFSIMETVEHLILRLNHVKNVFLEALMEREHGVRREKFRRAVKYHVNIMRISKLVNTSFNMCMFVHVLLTGAILGCVGYRLLKSYSLGAICLFVGWIVSMIMVCISGQRLRDQSLSIGDAICRSNWLDLNKELQKDLVLVLLRCQKPIFLNAGPFGYMTYAMILTVLKTSYSYLTLLSSTS
ncbi:odorant receptor Or2-like [Anoplophora glabripennis]|uniref:odorant receptor Or2-like n=1 Tax=Anoplophora glabripennis TaxID=217634 RepID=UPI000874E961|nr:odorant receptor Or2-like [Anoplophora glabripennis]